MNSAVFYYEKNSLLFSLHVYALVYNRKQARLRRLIPPTKKYLKKVSKVVDTKNYVVV